MLNVTDPIIKRFMENLHNSVERRTKHLSEGSYDDYLLENRVIKLFCEDSMLDPHHCAEMINSGYDRNLSGDRIIQLLRSMHLSFRVKRVELFDWARDTVDIFVKALETHAAKDFEKFIALRDKKIFDREGDRFKIQDRVVCLMLYVKHPELDNGNDTETVERFGNTNMKYFLLDVTDFLRNICIGRKSSGKSGGDKKDADKERIEQLENMLNRSDMMLKDLQAEFDARIKESHQNDMIEFFSLLNSEKYGCLLDAVLSARIGVRKLRKANFQLPPELGGLFIFIERFAQFIRDSKINPIMKPGTIQDLRLDEAEFCDYEGTPFTSPDEIKRVKVLSPGWFYQNKDVQISRPRIKESDE